MKRALPILFGTFLVFLIFSVFLLRTEPTNVSAAIATHVVISEIQIEGGSSTDEFVELYNPTGSPVDLTGWTLYRKTALGVIEIPVATASGSIPANGFYLFANTNFDGSPSADVSYSENIADNNSILIKDTGNSLVDLVGLGTSITSESATISNPIDNRSIERKANSTSTDADMAMGGAHEALGNGEDTDNNSSDFVRHVSPNISQPQNSSSSIEPPIVPTPTLTLTPTPSVEPSPTGEPSPTPTTEPSPTPSPTQTPSVTPSPTSEPSPTLSPSLTPTPILSLTPTPSVSPTPSVPSPRVIVQGPLFTCSINYKPLRFFNKIFFFPFVSCQRST